VDFDQVRLIFRSLLLPAMVDGMFHTCEFGRTGARYENVRPAEIDVSRLNSYSERELRAASPKRH